MYKDNESGCFGCAGLCQLHYCFSSVSTDEGLRCYNDLIYCPCSIYLLLLKRFVAMSLYKLNYTRKICRCGTHFLLCSVGVFPVVGGKENVAVVRKTHWYCTHHCNWGMWRWVGLTFWVGRRPVLSSPASKLPCIAWQYTIHTFKLSLCISRNATQYIYIICMCAVHHHSVQVLSMHIWTTTKHTCTLLASC